MTDAAPAVVDALARVGRSEEALSLQMPQNN
jgi:hypothetical protein